MFNSLAGKFLVANPFTNFNEIFDHAVIYIASHSENNAAVGLIINHLIDSMPYTTIFKMLKSSIEATDSKVQVYLGGPVEPNRGFILHTDDYDKNILFSLEKSGLSISSNVEILQDMLQNNGPKKSIFVMGYTGWAPGQLEQEILQNHWIITEVDSSILFSEKYMTKYNDILAKIGIDITTYSSQLGNC